MTTPWESTNGATDGLLGRLEAWFAERCDGEWEHHQGVSIGTLDNPGWWLKIDLTGTPLESSAFRPVTELGDPLDWMDCRVVDSIFVGHCGPRKLREVVEVFLDFADAEPER